MDNDETSHAETEATPQPEGPPNPPMQRADVLSPHNNIWENDSIPSLPPVPSPLEYSAGSSPLGLDVMSSRQEDTSLFSDKSLEERLHRTLNQSAVPRYAESTLPTLEVARLVQQVELFRETNVELRNENKLLIAGARSLEAQKEDLVEARMTAELRERETRQECTLLQQKLAQEKLEQQEHSQEKDEVIKELREQVATLQADKMEQVSGLQQALETTKSQLTLLQTQKSSVELEKNELAKELEETKANMSKLESEKEAHVTLCAEVGVQTESPCTVTQSCQTEPLPSVDCGVQTEPTMPRTTNAERPPEEDRMEALVSETLYRLVGGEEEEGQRHSLPLGERLSRIRDAAERASLVKDHQREISKLKAEHESEKTALKESFEGEKDRLLEQAMSEMNAGYKGLRRRLESDHEKRTEELERRYRKETNRVREEAEHEKATAAESVEVALSQAASAKQRCEREIRKRESLERRLHELKRDFDSHEKAVKEKHASDLHKMESGWNEERRSLLEALQRECNLVFDRNKNNTSPRSVTTAFFHDIQLGQKQNALSPLQNDDQSTNDAVSPSLSDLDRMLGETEALVEMVVNGNGSS